VVFAGEASAHDNVFQSVTAACNAPGAGAGATLTWTLYNDWNQSESGTFSTSQGTLSTTTLSIAASPTADSVPPNAKSQIFTQTLTATQLAALSPSSTISVGWSATWTDSTHVTGTLSTTLSALDLPNGCVQPKTTPTIATALAAPVSGTQIGNSWGDSATVTGRSGGPAPAGSVSFFICKTAGSSCTSGGTSVGTVGSPSSASGNASTYNLGSRYTPTTVGTYCFYTTYTPSGSESYLSAAGPAECFWVIPAGTVTTTHTSADVVTIGGTAFDTATVTGDASHGVPHGTVTFYSCGPKSSAGCTGGTEVPGSPNPATLTSSGSDTSTASSPSISPTATGTYCFAAVYTPDADSNYAGSSDNMSGDVVSEECFTVGPATPTIATTLSTPDSTTVGNAWGDSATVTGVTGGGAPGGSVSFSVCQVASGDSACTSGGSAAGTVDSPTSTEGNVSTYTLDGTYTPTSVGTYCFYSAYTPAATDNYTRASGPAECFTAKPADPQFGTQQSGSTSGLGTITVGGSVTDLATVIGNAVGGAPNGTVTFSECATGSSPAVCPSGTPLGSAVTLTAGAQDTSTATSAAFKPTAAGTYCFAAVYTPDAGSNYAGADDNMSGDVISDECFTATAVITIPSSTPPATSTAAVASAPASAPAAKPAATPATTPAIAFTGALLSQEWMIGLAALLLGSGLVILARWRRRTPRHTASRR